MWIGVGFLAVMLAGGIWLTSFFTGIHAPLAQSLEISGELARRGLWEEAAVRADMAKENWQKHRNFVAATADHEPLEEMEALLEQLELYEKSRDRVNYAALCARIAALAGAMGESQQLTWWNLL